MHVRAGRSARHPEILAESLRASASGANIQPDGCRSVSDADVDRIFHALADGTRRDILALAVGGRYSVSALAKRYPMSFAAVQKHVAVLEGAGLITKERQGRERLVRTDVDTVQRARVLLDGIEELWRARVDRIDDLLATEKRTTGGKR